MTQISCSNILPADLKVFLNHVYEYKKGVRRMVLYTVNRKYEAFATSRLRRQHIDFLYSLLQTRVLTSTLDALSAYGPSVSWQTVRSTCYRPKKTLFWERCWGMTCVHSANGTANAKTNPAEK